MSESPGGEMMPDYVTKLDLKESTKDIKKHIDLLMKPVIKDLGDHELILTGPSKINGMVGAVRGVQTKIKVVYGLMVFVGAGLVKIIFF